jgi:hypothetical protein
LSQHDFLKHFATCVAAVTDSSRILGTGFFLAPDRFVTCAHVVDGLNGNVLIRCGTTSAKGKILSSGNPKSLLESAGVANGPDIAIISTDGQISPSHPCVALDEEKPRLSDPLYAFGHARGEFQANGESLLLDYEGPAYDLQQHEVMGLRQGNVREGMSGAPVLNRRTGKVSGVLYASRDLKQDLGGRAIPIAQVLDMMPNLKAENEEFHRSNLLWRNLWDNNEGAVLLYDFPRGPVVDRNQVSFALIKSVASVYPTPLRAQALLLEANRLRLQADRDAGLIDPANIPPANATAVEYWFGAFNEARLQGPRMIASLLLAMDDWQFSDAIQRERKRILDELRAE